MRLNRVYVPGLYASGDSLTLPEHAARHLVQVLRLSAGAEVQVFNGQGQAFAATIEQARKKDATVRIGPVVDSNCESPLQITLLQGIARGEKMDLILQKATELGVTRVVPIQAARSTVKLNATTTVAKHAHWQGVISSACEQSGRSRLPDLSLAVSLDAALAELAGLRLLLHPAPDAPSLAQLAAALQSTTEITLLIGPEGGLDDSEIALALRSGFVACRLGSRVLRTETAALAAIAALQTLIGDFR